MDKFEKEMIATNVDLYHNMGFKGKNVKVLLREEGGEHAEETAKIIKTIMPECTLINCESRSSYIDGVYNEEVIINGEVLTWLELYDKYKPDIMSVSFAGGGSISKHAQENIQPLIDKGLIVVNSTGNDGSSGVKGIYEDVAINVGAVYIDNQDNIVKYNYSGYDKNEFNVDFVSFTGSYKGTSASCPFLVGLIGLTINRYGRMKQYELLEFMSRFSLDILDEGVDVKSGFGLYVLPTSEPVALPFTDITDEFYRKAIEFCFQNGVMSGISPSEFGGELPIRRYDIALILYRILGGIENV